jgi:hypothetical protein
MLLMSSLRGRVVAVAAGAASAQRTAATRVSMGQILAGFGNRGRET